MARFAQSKFFFDRVSVAVMSQRQNAAAVPGLEALLGSTDMLRLLSEGWNVSINPTRLTPASVITKRNLQGAVSDSAYVRTGARSERARFYSR
jgi:hypothetical protein